MTGLKPGAEAAIHSVWLIFKDSSTETVILVDANTTFNSINRKVALHNIQVTWFWFKKILINTYCSCAEIQLTKGTTQGDNLAMSFYALATIEIQNRFQIAASEIKQVWLTDDSTGAG